MKQRSELQRPEAISLILRSFNEAHYLRQTLSGIYRQAWRPKIDLIVIDSGSTDGSHSIIQEFKPQRFEIISKYIPGAVLNQGARLAQNDFLVYLNADATPANEYWLGELIDSLLLSGEDGIAFSRQVPRNDCRAIYAHDYERCFGVHRESKKWDHFFSMVSCATRKQTWSKFPFREDLQYAEDNEWSRRIKRAGNQIQFAEKSLVIHSHNYTVQQAYRRAKGDRTYEIAVADKEVPRPTWWKDVLFKSLWDGLKDAVYCVRRKRPLEIPYSFVVRYGMRLGRYHAQTAPPACAREG